MCCAYGSVSMQAVWLLLLAAASVTRATLLCSVAFDVTPEARLSVSLEGWRTHVYRTIQAANRELRMHDSNLLLAIHSVQPISLGVYATPSATLAAYAATRPAQACVHLLISSRRFADDSRTIGLAYVDSRCSATRSYAAVFDAFSSGARQTAFHEILHVLGAEHTEDDATSVLAPMLSYNFALPDQPGWQPARNATAQGCETDELTTGLFVWDENRVKYLQSLIFRADKTMIWVWGLAVLITAALWPAVRRHAAYQVPCSPRV